MREGRGLSREELAQRLNTTRMRVWRIETGTVGLDVGELPLWAAALDVEPAELYAKPAPSRRAGTKGAGRT